MWIIVDCIYIYILVLVFSCCIDCSELYIHVICGKDCGVVCSVSFNVSIARRKKKPGSILQKSCGGLCNMLAYLACLFLTWSAPWSAANPKFKKKNNVSDWLKISRCYVSPCNYVTASTGISFRLLRHWKDGEQACCQLLQRFLVLLPCFSCWRLYSRRVINIYIIIFQLKLYKRK